MPSKVYGPIRGYVDEYANPAFKGQALLRVVLDHSIEMKYPVRIQSGCLTIDGMLKVHRGPNDHTEKVFETYSMLEKGAQCSGFSLDRVLSVELTVGTVGLPIVIITLVGMK